MINRHGVLIDKQVVLENLTRIGSQIFKLLPYNEEGEDWVKPLETLCIEISGLQYLFPNDKDIFTLSCKLEGLRQQAGDIEFMLFRRMIFEMCSLVAVIKAKLAAEGE